MAIDPINGRLQSTTTAKTDQKKDVDTVKAPTSAPQQQDRIDLTDKASRLQNALATAPPMPVVNNERVAAIKQALDNGSYSIDAEKIAHKMTQFEALLNPGKISS